MLDSSSITHFGENCEVAFTARVSEPARRMTLGAYVYSRIILPEKNRHRLWVGHGLSHDLTLPAPLMTILSSASGGSGALPCVLFRLYFGLCLGRRFMAALVGI